MEWTPVEEGLPKKRDKYLVTCLPTPGRPHLHVEKAFFGDNIFWQGKFGRSNFRDITNQVTAWMPVPEPYKRKEN